MDSSRATLRGDGVFCEACPFPVDAVGSLAGSGSAEGGRHRRTGHGGGQNSGKPKQFSGKRARWHVAEYPESPATAVKLKYVAQPRPPPEVTEGSKVSAREKLQHIHTVLRVNRRAIFEMGLRV